MRNLAKELEDVLVQEGPMAGQHLATRIRARKADVLEVLHNDPRFYRSGHTKGSKWMTDRRKYELPQGVKQPSLRRAYELIRQAMGHIDGADVHGDEREACDDAIRALYRAEDDLVGVLRNLELSAEQRKGWKRFR